MASGSRGWFNSVKTSQLLYGRNEMVPATLIAFFSALCATYDGLQSAGSSAASRLLNNAKSDEAELCFWAGSDSLHEMSQRFSLSFAGANIILQNLGGNFVDLF